MRGRIIIAIGVLAAAAVAPPGVTHAAALTVRGQVADTVTLPATNTEARSFGRDLDGATGKDNQLGLAFSSLAGQGFDLTTAQDLAIAEGDIVLLHALRAARLTNTKDATWQVWYGEPTPDPDLTGGGTFLLDPAQPHSARLDATITDHRVKTAAGPIPLRLDLGAGVFELDLRKGRVFATCTRTGCTDGRMNGAVTSEDIEQVLIPELAQLFQAIVTQDCPGPGPESCASGSTGATLQGIFDTDDDLVVTAEEVGDNSLVQTVFTPDLDLFRANGNPGHDGVEDAMSFGIGFETVRATLTRP